MRREYTPEHLKLLHLVFGGRAGAVIAAVTIERAEERDHCDIAASGAPIIRHTDDGWLNDFCVVHEFAHAYCGFHWPTKMAEVDVGRAEAAAHLAEWSLAETNNDWMVRLVNERILQWGGAIAYVAEAIAAQKADPTGTLHERMEEILHG